MRTSGLRRLLVLELFYIVHGFLSNGILPSGVSCGLRRSDSFQMLLRYRPDKPRPVTCRILGLAPLVPSPIEQEISPRNDTPSSQYTGQFNLSSWKTYRQTNIAL